MSILKKIAKQRAAVRAEVKAARSRAVAEVKAQSKAQARQQKLLAKQEKLLLKTEAKGLKRKRRHEQKLAKTELAKIKAGRFNASNVNRVAGALRAAAPIVLPLVYRGIVAGREELEKRKARTAGVSVDQLASFGGHGASLKARTAGIRNSLADAPVPAGFKRDVRDRLDEIDAAINSAEFMTPQQRRRAHASISSDIDGVTQEIVERS